MAVFKSGCGAQISHHMPRCLDDPKAPVAKEVHGFVERTKFHPWSLKLFPFLLGDFRVENTRVELVPNLWVGIVRFEFRHTLFRGARAKVPQGIRECFGNGATVVEMRMAFLMFSFSRVWIERMMLSSYLKITVSTSVGCVP